MDGEEGRNRDAEGETDEVNGHTLKPDILLMKVKLKQLMMTMMMITN